jgi:hypothetical protein
MRSSWLGFACLALVSAPAWSQQPAGTTPSGLVVAPSAPNQQAETTRQGSGGQPANICKELVAFLDERAKKAQAPQAGQAPQASQAPAPNAPQASGQKPGTPQSAGQAAAQGGEKVQQSSGQSAPIPQGGETQGPTIAIDEARAWATGNDVKSCQDGARRLRKAGIALPPGLLALAALKPELIEKMMP